MVGINPGHHLPEDPGAVFEDLTEANLTLKYSKRLIHYLKKRKYNIKLIHYDILYQIVEDSRDCDILISIHCNSATNQKANGYEIFHHEMDLEGEKLANSIIKEFKILPLYNRGVKKANFYILSNTNIPTILIEIGFLSNKEDREYISDKFAIEKISNLIAMGIDSYIKEVN